MEMAGIRHRSDLLLEEEGDDLFGGGDDEGGDEEGTDEEAEDEGGEEGEGEEGQEGEGEQGEQRVCLTAL